MDRRAFITTLLGGAVLPSVARGQGADKYPTRPVHMIVPFAPGGASDFAARLLQPGLSQFLGQQIVVENRAGAAGNIGMEAAARAEPDGYTLFLGNVGTISINPTLFGNTLSVKPERDFAPVTLVAETPGIFIATSKFPPNNVKEFVDYVKKNPGKVNYASPGSGSLNRLDMEVFRKAAGLDMVHVPYKGGAGPAVTDVMAGHVECMFVTISSAMSLVKGGSLKAYAVTTRERVKSLPDVPTMIESGYPESVSTSWQGLLVPAKTPQPVIGKLFAAVQDAMRDQNVRERMTEAGVFPVTSQSPEEFKAYLAAESAKWSQVIIETGAQPD